MQIWPGPSAAQSPPGLPPLLLGQNLPFCLVSEALHGLVSASRADSITPHTHTYMHTRTHTTYNCACTYIYSHVYVYTQYTHAYTHMCTHAHSHTCTHRHMCAHVHTEATSVHVIIHTHTCAYSTTHAVTHTCTPTHVPMCVHIHRHTLVHTHPHMHALTLQLCSAPSLPLLPLRHLASSYSRDSARGGGPHVTTLSLCSLSFRSTTSFHFPPPRVRLHHVTSRGQWALLFPRPSIELTKGETLMILSLHRPANIQGAGNGDTKDQTCLVTTQRTTA